MNSAVNRSNDHSTDDKTSRPTIVVPEGNKLLNFTFHTIQPQDSSKSNGFVSFISQREQKKDIQSAMHSLEHTPSYQKFKTATTWNSNIVLH
jgi:hypothetical protein